MFFAAFVCLQILFTFFTDKPLLPEEYFQGFDVQTSELNDEHQGGENQVKNGVFKYIFYFCFVFEKMSPNL